MTDSASDILAIILGLGVFAVIVAVGWRSVQNRRIVRLQGADGHETIIVAREDDDITSVTTAETTRPAPAGTAADDAAGADAAGRDRLDRVVTSTE